MYLGQYGFLFSMKMSTVRVLTTIAVLITFQHYLSTLQYWTYVTYYSLSSLRSFLFADRTSTSSSLPPEIPKYMYTSTVWRATTLSYNV